MIRRLILCCCLVGLLHAEQPAGTQLSADRTDYLLATDETALIGHAELREGDLLVTADEFRFKGQQGTNPETITASGHVVYTRGPLRILADRVVFHRVERTFTAENIRLGSFPYYIEGASASGARDTVTVHQARISYGEPGPWQPTARAEQITLNPETRQVRSARTQLGIGGVQPVPFPKFEQNLSDPLWSLLTFSGGYRGSLGAFVDLGLHLPVTPGLRLGGDVGYYTERGLLAGPSGSYSSPTDPARLRGSFQSGYINDHGDKKTDLLGRAVPENRAFFEWQHQQQISETVTLNGQFNWWRDSEVLRDFRPREFFPVQQPDSFVELTHAGENLFASAFARFRPNSFQVVQQRTPELRVDLLPMPIGGGFYERFNASIAFLRETPLPDPQTGLASMPANELPAAGAFLYPAEQHWSSHPYAGSAIQELQSTRMDAYYALTRPISSGDWFALTPVAGGRVTHYMNTRGAAKAGPYTRVLGEVGADAELHASGTFAYRNEAWKIDGLRHLFTPRISYRYIPQADKGRAYIPPIDRESFSTYLPPLGLGDVRSIDDLQPTHTLRLALLNTLQTRDAGYGSRDLLRLNVANDFRFKRAPGERDVSEIHAEFAAMPARWLEVGVYNSFAPQTFTLREFNSGVTVRNGDAWSVRFGNSFFRHQLEDYVVDGRARLNENFDVLTQVRYDQRKHRFTEQTYGVVQNLANMWRISYLVSFYSGRQRESGFGFSIQVDTVRF
ncbi:LPS assembly protein LptD [Opitutus sp. ER46]|uniref:LPS-assembly protein LptD n=1 Tax=Opitutus sp. ER46 TaxID=2161864 RepID=UPI001304DD05|nr:LPS assembly protein LptD [Opitutus sp. ER46]